MSIPLINSAVITRRFLHFSLVWLLFALNAGFALEAAEPGGKPDDTHLLNNIDSLKVHPLRTGTDASVADLRAELANLWDRGDAARQPLDVRVVHSESKNGIRVEGIYINGYKGPAGQDRFFFYYAHPEKMDGKIPAYIELTGGGEPERSLWMAGAYKCVVLDVEWRAPKNRFRSQWMGCDPGAMKSLTSLKDDLAYRFVTALRRAIDFLEQQSGIDTGKIGCGGGSMGGYYTLLLAGVDERVSFGVDELGAGHLGDTGSALGEFALDAGRKAIWLQAFDPLTFAGRTKARVFMNFSADDYFFWLGDGIVNYEALAGEKRFAITPNFDHNDGAFGKKKLMATGWIDYACGRETSYPEIKEVRGNGASYQAVTTPDITDATFCWSPGSEKLMWPSRYWREVPAVKTDAGWKAEVPALYAGLARVSFFTAKDAKGRSISSLPVFAPGIDPESSVVPLWAGGSIWDTESGISAWRQIGPNADKGVAARVEPTADGRGLRIFPGEAGSSSFSLVTDSALLACGQAEKHRGIRIMLNGGKSPGKLTVMLVRNFGAAALQQEYTTTVSYGVGENAVDLTWGQFAGTARNSAPPAFDSIRLEGARPDGTPLEVGRISFLDSDATTHCGVHGTD